MSERLTFIIIVDKEVHKLVPGEATYATANQDGSRKGWFLGCPGNCEGVANLTNHQSTYEEALTISPSILCGCGAHYFIVNNQIRWC